MAIARWAEWNAALAQTRDGATPAELHGSATGYLCAGGSGDARALLTALALTGGDVGADASLEAMLGAAASDIRAKLRAGVGVDPLLPDGMVSARADAMVDWCRGFLGGLGLTGALEAHGQAPEIARVLADFGRIASTHLESNEGDAALLAEVLDFIRAGVLQLHAHLVPGARP